MQNMKRVVMVVLLAVVLAASGCSSKGMGPALPDRLSLLPDSLVSELAGEPMELAYDRLDANEGFACWAWQETEGLPRLLVVEIRFPPADCDGLYRQASDGADAIAVTNGEACYDHRAAHLRAGIYYIRISALGFEDEEESLRQVAMALAEAAK